MGRSTYVLVTVQCFFATPPPLFLRLIVPMYSIVCGKYRTNDWVSDVVTPRRGERMNNESYIILGERETRKRTLRGTPKIECVVWYYYLPRFMS